MANRDDGVPKRARALAAHLAHLYGRRMGREWRVDVPGWHHVTCRTVDGVDALEDDDDKRLLQRQLLVVVRRFNWSCAAYCLMSNHYHLLFKIPSATLQRGLHRLNGVFADKYNQRHERRGHVFGARYRSRPIESESHLFRAFRYVERNPIRAGIAARPSDWRWSSFRALAGLVPAPPFLDVSGALALFGPTVEAAHAEYARFIELPE